MNSSGVFRIGESIEVRVAAKDSRVSSVTDSGGAFSSGAILEGEDSVPSPEFEALCAIVQITEGEYQVDIQCHH